MGKKCAGAILILAAFVACAGGSGSVPPVSAVAVPDVARPLGQLHIEPYAIVFTRRAKGSQTIRVSQPGWRGHYKMTTTCNLVSVNLRKYGPGSVSFWDAARIAHGKERCRITFVGSRGPRGTNSVEIRVLRRK
jgi:hypothetical protein